jgi:hypothetical protein
MVLRRWVIRLGGQAAGPARRAITQVPGDVGTDLLSSAGSDPNAPKADAIDQSPPYRSHTHCRRTKRSARPKSNIVSHSARLIAPTPREDLPPPSDDRSCRRVGYKRNGDFLKDVVSN